MKSQFQFANFPFEKEVLKKPGDIPKSSVMDCVLAESYVK